MGPQSGHYAPTMCLRCAHIGSQPFGGSIEGCTVGPLLCPLCAHSAPNYVFKPLLGFNLWAYSRAIMCLLCAHDVPTFGYNRLEVQSKGPQWGHSVPRMRLLCARYVFKPLWGSIYRPTVGRLGAYYAPTMRPPWVSTVLGFNRKARSVTVPNMRLLHAHYVLKPLWGFNPWAQSGRHYAPTMNPLCV